MARWTSSAQRNASTTLWNSTNRPSPIVLTMPPPCSSILGSISLRRRALRRTSVPSSSAPIIREYPTTSAARIAARRRTAFIPAHPRRACPRIHAGSSDAACRAAPRHPSRPCRYANCARTIARAALTGSHPRGALARHHAKAPPRRGAFGDDALDEAAQPVLLARRLRGAKLARPCGGIGRRAALQPIGDEQIKHRAGHRRPGTGRGKRHPGVEVVRPDKPFCRGAVKPPHPIVGLARRTDHRERLMASDQHANHFSGIVAAGEVGQPEQRADALRRLGEGGDDRSEKLAYDRRLSNRHLEF